MHWALTQAGGLSAVKASCKGKGLGGKKKLTNSIIDRLQNYFGIAFRQNVGNLKAMEDDIMASLFHVSNFHQYCPKIGDSWWLYQQDKMNGTETYKVREKLPVDVKPLRKCLRGKNFKRK